MIEAVVYDFGGVLVEIDFGRVFERWASLAGVPVDEVRRRFAFGPAYEAHERGEIDVAEYFRSLRADLAIDLDDADFDAGWQAVFGDEIAPTIALTRALAPRLPQYLFSNTNASHHAYWSRRYPEALASLRRVFVSHEMGLRKPERAAFEHIAREIGVPVERIVFFDDMPANVEGARAAGLQAVVVRSHEDVARALAPWLGRTDTPA